MKRGRIIVIEGADGTGKATQTELLKKELEKRHYKVDMYDFPQYTETFFGNLVGRFLKGDFGGLHEVNPHLASVLYAADRWQAKERLDNSVKKGRIALLNRYALSSMAFQGAKVSRRKILDYLKFSQELEYDTFGIPKEDIDIILTVPPKLSQKLIIKKAQRSYLGKKRKKDIHEADLNFQLRVTEMYKLIAKKYKHMRIINCSLPNGELMTIEDIHRKIWKIVEKLLD